MKVTNLETEKGNRIETVTTLRKRYEALFFRGIDHLFLSIFRHQKSPKLPRFKTSSYLMHNIVTVAILLRFSRSFFLDFILGMNFLRF